MVVARAALGERTRRIQGRRLNIRVTFGISPVDVGLRDETLDDYAAL